MEIWNALHCWMRQKNTSETKPPMEEVQMKESKKYLECAGCFKTVKCKEEFETLAKIQEKTFGFCSIDCYYNWLSTPSIMYFSPNI
jgi:hypothetical protein